MMINSTDEYAFIRDGRVITTKLFFENGYWWTVYKPHIKATSIDLKKSVSGRFGV